MDGVQKCIAPATPISVERVEQAQRYARQLVHELGTPGAARALGISVDALARLLAGLRSHAGTISIVLERARGNQTEVR